MATQHLNKASQSVCGSQVGLASPLLKPMEQALREAPSWQLRTVIQSAAQMLRSYLGRWKPYCFKVSWLHYFCRARMVQFASVLCPRGFSLFVWSIPWIPKQGNGMPSSQLTVTLPGGELEFRRDNKIISSTWVHCFSGFLSTCVKP